MILKPRLVRTGGGGEGVLVRRGLGGLGDILMHRMVFRDLKASLNGERLHFACPPQYVDAVSDHPYLDAVIPLEAARPEEYRRVYDTTKACMETECALSPMPAPHRSDIWAAVCKVRLKDHSMHLRLTDAELAAGRASVDAVRRRGRPAVALAPLSAWVGKDLSEFQANVVAEGAERLGLSPFGLHSERIPWLRCPTVVPGGIRHWLGVVAAADYVVSVDTSVFHAAGGLGRPLVGVFSYADGKVYGRYFDFALVQRHRDHTPGWTCGPCYNWTKCSRCPSSQLRKPCIEDITGAEVVGALRELLRSSPTSSSATR
jgi:hypothetical protein